MSLNKFFNSLIFTIMAIFNSIVIGKASGKIGNVVLCSLKGQNVAKSRNYSPTNPRTELQTNSRGKMSNAVLAWQFLSIFLSNATAIRKSTESVYNAFIRLTKNAYDTVVVDSRRAAAAMLAGLSFGSLNFLTVVSATLDGHTLKATFLSNDIAYVAGNIVHFIAFSPLGEELVITSKVITELEYTAQLVSIANIDENCTSVSAYIVSPDGKKCSNILFN